LVRHLAAAGACRVLYLGGVAAARQRARHGVSLCSPSRRPLCGFHTRIVSPASVRLSPFHLRTPVLASASSKSADAPARRAREAPRSWPKNPLAINVSGMADQLIPKRAIGPRESLCSVLRQLFPSLPDPSSPVSTPMPNSRGLSHDALTSCRGFDAPDRGHPGRPRFAELAAVITVVPLVSRPYSPRLPPRSAAACSTGPFQRSFRCTKRSASIAATRALSSLPLRY